jgi:phosphoenolpyruvate synthase/pyruvate phosphate dikinase
MRGPLTRHWHWQIMRGICQVAVDVEKAFGGKPQDIEGCYRGGKFYVVQTRPQV